MAHIQRILVPSDGSPPSVAALHEATRIAEDLGASVDVLHVTPEHRILATPVESDVPELERAFAEARGTLGDRLERLDQRGDPLKIILAAAPSYDLIVIGTHGRIGRLHSLLGSVAEGVVRNATIPVLTVRERRPEESFTERRHWRASVAEEPR